MTKRTATSPQSTTKNTPRSGKSSSETKTKTKKSGATSARTTASSRTGANDVSARESKREETPRRAKNSPTHIDDDVIADDENPKSESETTTRKDPSDRARDKRLSSELEREGLGRSAQDRHNERLTAVEATEDDVSEEDEELDDSKKNRDPLLAEQSDEEEDAEDDKGTKRS